MCNIRPKLLFWHLSLFYWVLHSFIRNFPLFCHNVEWNKQPPQAFFIALYFSHYLHPFRELPCWFSLIPVSNPLLPSQTLLTVIFKLPCMCCLSVRSFFPPAPVWKSSARCLWSLCDGGHHQRERDEKRKWEGEGSVFHVFVACEVRYSACSRFCMMRVWNEGLIYCFVFLLSGAQQSWLNRAGENICTTKAICVYYGLFHYVYGSVSAHFCSDNLHLEQIAYLNFVWIAFIAICTIFKQDAIFFF